MLQYTVRRRAAPEHIMFVNILISTLVRAWDVPCGRTILFVYCDVTFDCWTQTSNRKPFLQTVCYCCRKYVQYVMNDNLFSCLMIPGVRAYV